MVVNGMCQTLPFSTLGATRQWSSGLKDSLVSGFVAAVTLQWGGHDGILAVEDYWDYSVICTCVSNTCLVHTCWLVGKLVINLSGVPHTLAKLAIC